MGRRVAVALVLGVVGVAAANAADFAGGRSVGDELPVIRRAHRAGNNLRLSAWCHCALILVRAVGKSTLFPKDRQDGQKSAAASTYPPHRVSKNEDYYRFWSVSSVFAPVQGPTGGYGVPGSAVTPISGCDSSA